LYGDWDWNTPVTVLVNGQPIEFPLTESDVFAVVSITPPHRNSARNVTWSTKKIMIDELKKGAENMQKNEFQQLWANTPFFTKYQSYLEIVCESENKKHFLTWAGYIESRLVALITEIEKISKHRLIVHIWPAAFKNDNIALPYQFSSKYFIGLEILPTGDGEQHRFSITEPIEKFQLACFGWTGYTKAMNIQILRTKGEKLSKLQLEILDIEHL